MDVSIQYDEQGHPERIEEDTRHRGKIDRIRIFRNGDLVKLMMDSDGDGFIETEILYKDGKPITQTEDRNRDGKTGCEDHLQRQR